MTDDRANAMANTYYPLAIRYGRSQARRMSLAILDVDAIDSAAHDALAYTLRAWKHQTEEGFRTYLYRAVHGKLIDAARTETSRRRTLPMVQCDTLTVAADDVTARDVDLQDFLDWCAPFLTRSQRAYVNAYVSLGMPAAIPGRDIGELFGQTKSHTHKMLLDAFVIMARRWIAAGRDGERRTIRPVTPPPAPEAEIPRITGEWKPIKRRPPRKQSPANNETQDEHPTKPPPVPDH